MAVDPVGQLDRGLRRRHAGPRHDPCAAAAGAPCGAAAVAAEPADLADLGALDPRFGRHPDRRGAGYHPLYREPADLPGSPGDVLRPRHHRTGDRRDHPCARPDRGRGWHGRVRPPDGRAGKPAGRHGRGLRVVPSGPGRVAGRRPAGAVCQPRPEPLLPRARGMAELDHQAGLRRSRSRRRNGQRCGHRRRRDGGDGRPDGPDGGYVRPGRRDPVRPGREAGTDGRSHGAPVRSRRRGRPAGAGDGADDRRSGQAGRGPGRRKGGGGWQRARRRKPDAPALDRRATAAHLRGTRRGPTGKHLRAAAGTDACSAAGRAPTAKAGARRWR